MQHTWTLKQFEEALKRFETELQDADLRESTIRTYMDRTQVFLRWLAGEYRPTGPR